MVANVRVFVFFCRDMSAHALPSVNENRVTCVCGSGLLIAIRLISVIPKADDRLFAQESSGATDLAVDII